MYIYIHIYIYIYTLRGVACAHSAPASKEAAAHLLLRPAALMPRRQHDDATYPFRTALMANGTNNDG